MSWWKAFLARLSNLLGQRQGRADQRQADQVAALKQEIHTDEAVAKADAAAPRDRAAVADELRAGRF